VILTTPAAAFGAGKEKLLFKFNGHNGLLPTAPVTFDSSGNLYGTTVNGGSYHLGEVFQLMQAASGRWTEKVLYSFNGTDGQNPYAGVVIDAAGNLYGTTVGGGAYVGYGTVFRLSPDKNGKWKVTILHSFNNDGVDGVQPHGGLVFDAAGNLYGTTASGGSSHCKGPGCGTVFELSPGNNGQWTETILYAFRGDDGGNPLGTLIFDKSGNLYGTAETGGPYHANCADGCGTVFRLSPGSNGQWTEKVLHAFGKGIDGELPTSGVILDRAGNLYGTTASGGLIGTGTVFELTPHKDGDWSETLLHHFLDNGKDGAGPNGVILNRAENTLYGTTANGGKAVQGTVFALTPGAGGKWDEKILHTFAHLFEDGSEPAAGLTFDVSGNLYGTTSAGGWQCNGLGCGVVFEITQ